jgi:hypothetical protein
MPSKSRETFPLREIISLFLSLSWGDVSATFWELLKMTKNMVNQNLDLTAKLLFVI